MLFYKVVLNGSCQGQDIRNILYYREGLGITWTNLFFHGAETLANCVKDVVWPKLKALAVNDYTLDTIDVLPHDDSFIPTVSQPFSLAVGEAGLNASVHAGMTQVCNFKFVLEPTGLQNGVWPPKKAYIAFGPFPANGIEETGYMPIALMQSATITDIQDVLAQDLVFIVPTPGSFYPIRVRRNSTLLGLAKWNSWADVSACNAQRRISNRRSRMPEA